VAPASFAEKPKVADVDSTVPLGPSPIDVSGGVVSGGGSAGDTFQFRSAGVASRLPEVSRARTENVCDPGLSDAYERGDAQLA
jgi:hypothetical protein